MIYFTEAFNDFFKGLAPNNNKDWFHANKKQYERAVKKPFDKFLEDLIANIKQQYLPTLDIAPKDAKFRINRDIRFAKDKTPYKMHVSAVIAPQGKKDREATGLYLQLGVGEIWLGGGSYAIGKDNLLAIRQYLATHPNELQQVINAPLFKTVYPEGIQGEKNKRLPKSLQAAAAQQPLIANKQLYFMATYEDESLITQPDFMAFVLQHYKAGIQFNQLLKTALQHDKKG